MRTYISATGYGIDVGESASENDELTFSADPDHWWFHVSGYPGAHVVARVRTLDRETRRDAAILAVHHSKAPVDAKMTVVDTCRVANVSKPTNVRGLVDVSEEGVSELCVFRNKATEKARLGRLLSRIFKQS